jgi:hypothetical protein
MTPARAKSRVTGVSRVRRVFGTEGFDPLDYAQWTRYLVVRPLYVGSFGGVGTVIAMIVAAGSGAGLALTFGAATVGCVLGLVVGGWRWLRRERRDGRLR